MEIGIGTTRECTLRGKFRRYLGAKVFRKNYDWSEKFASFMNQYGLESQLVSIEAHNWIQEVAPFDVIIWKPELMGVRSSQVFKEKIYFIQFVLGKRVFPNYETIWHFDSKIAQSYLLEHGEIRTPKTFISFDYNEAIDATDEFRYPVVVKESSGAGSSGVRLMKSKRDMVKYINKRFLWENILSRKLNSRLFDRFGQIYVQEFLEDNKADLRITVIGDKYAYGFWRRNRENDFRASGSGNIDYETDIPQDILRYCSQISKRYHFDSMAYDILFRGNDLFIVEMSYGYNERALYNSKGYYELDENGDVLRFNEGNYWPQELWVKWIKACLDGRILSN